MFHHRQKSEAYAAEVVQQSSSWFKLNFLLQHAHNQESTLPLFHLPNHTSFATLMQNKQGQVTS